MMRIILAIAALTGALFCAGTAVAAASVGDRQKAIEGPSLASGGMVSCGIYCPDPDDPDGEVWCELYECPAYGTDSSSSPCCGWGRCFGTGGCVGLVTCCEEGQTCKDGVEEGAEPECIDED